MSEFIVSPTVGDVVVLATVCYSSLSFLFPVPLLVEGPGLSMPGVCLGSRSWVCTGYTYPTRTPRPLGFQL